MPLSLLLLDDGEVVQYALQQDVDAGTGRQVTDAEAAGLGTDLPVQCVVGGGAELRELLHVHLLGPAPWPVRDDVLEVLMGIFENGRGRSSPHLLGR